MDLSAKWNMLKNVFTTTMYLITTRKKRWKKLPNRTIWGEFVAASSADNSALPRNPFPECRKCLTFQIIINHHINTVQICTTELFLQSGCQDSSSSALGLPHQGAAAWTQGSVLQTCSNSRRQLQQAEGFLARICPLCREWKEESSPQCTVRRTLRKEACTKSPD